MFMSNASKYAVRVISRRSPREGEGGTAPAPQGQQNPPAGGTGATGTQQTAPAPQIPIVGNSQQQTPLGTADFTAAQQARVNHLLAEERRKTAASNQALAEQLEVLKQNKNLTEQERDNLQVKIDELTATFTTKEQQAQTEMQKLQKRYDTDIKDRETKIERVTKLYHDTLKEVGLVEAAKFHKAISTEQIKKFLWDQTVVEQELDESGQPTGGFVPRVNFVGKDKEGKPVKLKLSPADAVKAMTEDPEQYGNLFEATARAGLGQSAGAGTPSGGGGRIPNIEEMTPEQWRKFRGQIKQELAKVH